MGFQGPQDIHLLFSKMFFHPGGHHSPDAVMVAQGALVRLDPMDNPLLEFPEFRQVFHLCDKDKVQIGALAVEMGGMGHADGMGKAFDIGPDLVMKLMEIFPGDRGFKGVDEHAEIIEGIPHVRV